LNFLFWNTNRNDKIDDYLIKLVNEKSIDIIILAEYNNDVENLCRKLSIEGLDFKETQTFKVCKRIKVLCKQYYQDEIIRETKHYTIKRIYNDINDYIIVAVHFPSKRNSQDKIRESRARHLITDLKKAERDAEHSNTIIIGDFNANPFEDTMISGECINAIPYRNIAKKISRELYDDELEFFYNPMWNFFGDNSLPYGTYYYDKEQLTKYYWNIFDQVVIRPSLIDLFIENSLEIVSSIDGNSLFDKNSVPNKEISDHLPIVFNMREVF
jgi:exonuclease III